MWPIKGRNSAQILSPIAIAVKMPRYGSLVSINPFGRNEGWLLLLKVVGFQG